MLIGERLRELREAKNLSQGDIEKRTGLVRPYTSRVSRTATRFQGGEVLRRWRSMPGRGGEVPALPALFYEGKRPPTKFETALSVQSNGEPLRRSGSEPWPSCSGGWRKDRKFLLTMAQQMARPKSNQVMVLPTFVEIGRDASFKTYRISFCWL